MAYTEAQLTTIIGRLETALAKGERTVQIADRSVTYNSAQEIRDRIDYFQGLLAGVRGTRRQKQTFMVSGKGF